MSTAPSERPDPVEPAGADPADMDADEILPEYDFRGAERGKYAARYAEGTNVVVPGPGCGGGLPHRRVGQRGVARAGGRGAPAGRAGGGVAAPNDALHLTQRPSDPCEGTVLCGPLCR